jgi:hypothetical protein
MDAVIFHQSTYTPSITYSLPVVTISTMQLNKMQRKSILAVLNKLGLSKSFPHPEP